MRIEHWLLPDGVEDILPPDAATIETMRRTLLDLHQQWGYTLVFPPLIEFLPSLLTATSDDLHLLTYKITDQLTGQQMGIRADFTPQVARIAAHSLKNEEISRLCYCGDVLHTKALYLSASRIPLQFGAELFGDASVESDVEIISLLLNSLQNLTIRDIHLTLGHVGFYRSIIDSMGLTADLKTTLFECLQRKDAATLQKLSDDQVISKSLATQLIELSKSHGDVSILSSAKKFFGGEFAEIAGIIDYLETIYQHVHSRFSEASISFDLAELRGYHYHTGVVFAVYHPKVGQAIAQGGRYDAIGKIYGHTRPATGYSTDLKTLLRVIPTKASPRSAIFVAATNVTAAFDKIQELRTQGEIVITGFSQQSSHPKTLGCDRELIQKNHVWQIVPL